MSDLHRSRKLSNNDTSPPIMDPVIYYGENELPPCPSDPAEDAVLAKRELAKWPEPVILYGLRTCLSRIPNPGAATSYVAFSFYVPHFPELYREAREAYLITGIEQYEINVQQVENIFRVRNFMPPLPEVTNSITGLNVHMLDAIDEIAQRLSHICGREWRVKLYAQFLTLAWIHNIVPHIHQLLQFREGFDVMFCIIGRSYNPPQYSYGYRTGYNNGNNGYNGYSNNIAFNNNTYLPPPQANPRVSTDTFYDMPAGDVGKTLGTSDNLARLPSPPPGYKAERDAPRYESDSSSTAPEAGDLSQELSAPPTSPLLRIQGLALEDEEDVPELVHSCPKGG